MVGWSFGRGVNLAQQLFPMSQGNGKRSNRPSSSTVLTIASETLDGSSSHAMNIAPPVVQVAPMEPAPKPKRKRIVVDEDEYYDGLKKIIEKDFFPELDALRAASGIGTENTVGTPTLTLSQFTSKYTTDDNDSFDALVEKEQQKRAAQFKWINEPAMRLRDSQERARITYLQKLEKSMEQGKTKNAEGENEAITFQAANVRSQSRETWSVEVKNNLLFPVEGTGAGYTRATADPPTCQPSLTRLSSVDESAININQPGAKSQPMQPQEKQVPPSPPGYPLLPSPSPQLTNTTPPLMTWGHIPRGLAITPASPFHLREGDVREEKLWQQQKSTPHVSSGRSNSKGGTGYSRGGGGGGGGGHRHLDGDVSLSPSAQLLLSRERQRRRQVG
jgi:hypothetical protein